jgi:hypothetical protein
MHNRCYLATKLQEIHYSGCLTEESGKRWDCSRKNHRPTVQGMSKGQRDSAEGVYKSFGGGTIWRVLRRVACFVEPESSV